MRLYEVINEYPCPEEEQEETGTMEPNRILMDTGETYPSKRAFVTYAREHGEKYADKIWMLLSEGSEIAIFRETRYEVKIAS